MGISNYHWKEVSLVRHSGLQLLDDSPVCFLFSLPLSQVEGTQSQHPVLMGLTFQRGIQAAYTPKLKRQYILQMLVHGRVCVQDPVFLCVIAGTSGHSACVEAIEQHYIWIPQFHVVWDGVSLLFTSVDARLAPLQSSRVSPVFTSHLTALQSFPGITDVSYYTYLGAWIQSPMFVKL